MSGEARGAGAAALRVTLAAAEPVYAGAAALRNWIFDRGLRTPRRLLRPVISVGNITTGGTGKTPVVRWLASRLREHGRHVAVLARGYGAEPGKPGDEQIMLERLLNVGGMDPVAVGAHPDRFALGSRLLSERPKIDAFVLDDGFQHRQLARDLDIVLINATSPFGYGHVLPRGMLREPLAGLSRAGAFVITHADQVAGADVSDIERRIREHNPDAPIYRAAHAHAGLTTASGETRPPDELGTKGWFAICGIGDPQTFVRQLESAGGRRAGHRWFADHHRYTAADFDEVRRDARAAGADVLVTTEKDWAKLESLAAAGNDDLPILRVDVRTEFFDDDEAQLWAQILGALKPGR